MRKYLTGARISALVLLAALMPSAWLLWSNLDMPYLGFHDDGIYWTCSRSIAAGHGYRIAHLPGEPYQTKFPPLYPLYLSLAPTLAAASIATWLWLPLFALLSYFALEELDLSQQIRLVIAGILLVHPVCVWAGTRLLSELMFASLVMATAIAARRAILQPAFAVAAGALASAACLAKSAGLPLLLVLPTFLFARTRSLRPGLVSLSVMLPSLSLWHWWSAAHRDTRVDFQYYVDYFGWFRAEFGLSDLPRIVGMNLLHLFRGVGNLPLLSLFTGYSAVGFAAAAVASFGLARLVRQNGFGFLTLFACGYAAILLAWNFVPGERFLLPLLPLIIAAMSNALGRAYRYALLIVGITTAFGLFYAADGLSMGARTISSEMESAAAWIRSKTPQDTHVLTSFDVQLYLRTGRHTYRPALPVGFQYRRTRSRLDAIAGIPDLCRREHIQYYVRLKQDNWFRADDPEERQAVDSVLQRSFEPVFTTSAATVYRLDAAPIPQH